MLRSVHLLRSRVPSLNGPTWRRLSSYEKKTPVEHVLLRPGMYIGQVESVAADTWLYDNSIGRMSKEAIVYNPALLKLFDEILVNAADNKQRDPTMTEIDITVKRLPKDELEVAVMNDGKSIPLTLHETEKIYIPELIFGHLLTGSNFNDQESRLTGGSHGYGAKLTNIFSTSFTVEAQDGKHGMYYKQTWANNMSEVSAPTIEQTSTSRSFTRITFKPDLARFGTLGSSKNRSEAIDQIIRMFQRRALDVAACVGPTVVRFNVEDSRTQGKAAQGSDFTIPAIRSFEEYVQLFRAPVEAQSDSSDTAGGSGETEGSGALRPIRYCAVNPRWEVALGESSTGLFENMSYVNSVWTMRGGAHVNIVAAQVVKAIEEALAKKGVTVTPAVIKNKLMVFVNCKIENPSFDGQTKDALNTKAAAFGSTCKLPDKFVKEFIAQSGVVENILEEAAVKEQNRLLKRTKPGRKQMLEVPKLEDAHEAGGDRALECTLILTEGDSAKALAVAGLEVVGRALYGVMPLRGKVLNVRCAPTSQIYKNEEFVNLCRALGLEFSRTYRDGLQNEGLRYGKVMIMCDQDTDGSHIKGLVINLFHHFWPALLEHDGFLQQFITPLVKAKVRGGDKEVHSFFSIPEFKQWQSSRTGTNEEGSDSEKGAQASAADEKYTVKYYKGLGTSTAAEGREYFGALARHRRSFQPLDKSDADVIDLAFNKARAGDRKTWLTEVHDPQTFLDPHQDNLSYGDFINKELIHFSYADIQRSIPSVVDGLKPSQRKVLYGCFKKKLVKEESKVVQIAGYIAEQTAYHHGEASLHSTIINMAQDFVGSNNVPFLVASGQFGTRAQGGKDFASPRYVFTRLSSITRLLFPEEDDGLLHYEQEDGLTVEPKYFVPVIPTLLLNGSEGIGTGWSTSVPTHHLPHVVEQVRCRVTGRAPPSILAPYVVGFRGHITPATLDAHPVQYRTSGVVRRNGPTKVVISELPVGAWTDDYKKQLIAMVERGDIRSFQELHSTDSVHFEVSGTTAQLDALEKKGLVTAFKLSTTLSLSNMHAFDRDGKIRKYQSASDIVDAHYEVRRELYGARKEALERRHAADELRCRNRSRFISSILSGELQILQGPGKPTSEFHLANELRSRGFAQEREISRVLSGEAINTADLAEASRADFGYLLDLPIHSLTEERSVQLKARAQEALTRFDEIRTRSVEDLWLSDLDRISSAYEDILLRTTKEGAL